MNSEKRSPVTRRTLLDFLGRVDAAYAGRVRAQLIGETTQVFEGWRKWTTQVELIAEVDPARTDEFTRVVRRIERDMNLIIIDEHPADVIPLPRDWESRMRRVDPGTDLKHVELHHFDPYSVALRFIARGDEPDYHLVLMFLEHGWVTLEELDAKLEELLPRFTRETIQQDPAEFRRKYKGLEQMRRTLRARTTHRPTVA